MFWPADIIMMINKLLKPLLSLDVCPPLLEKDSRGRHITLCFGEGFVFCAQVKWQSCLCASILQILCDD